MKRRDALKGIGLTLGYAAVTPTVISLLQSCKSDPNTWIPEFFTVEEGTVVTNLINQILPKTENSPGALDVNVPEFLDKFSLKVLNESEQNKLKNGLSEVSNELLGSEKKMSKIKAENYTELLNKYLRANKEAQERFKKDKKESIVLKTLLHLRDSAVWAYKTSEQIGENVLAYDPIPTDYFCGDLDELTQGKAWSLS